AQRVILIRYSGVLARLNFQSSSLRTLNSSSTLYEGELVKGCPKGPIHFLLPQFLCSAWQPVSSFSNRDAKGKHNVIDQARFLLPSKSISLVRPAPQAFPRPDRRDALAVERRSGQGWRVAPPEGPRP